MHSPDTNIQQMIEQLNQFQIPSSLMECFDAYREEAMKAASLSFGRSQMAWFLDLLNHFRGPDDYKPSLLELFDPGMFTCNHAAWNAPPGTRIEIVDRFFDYPALSRHRCSSAICNLQTISCRGLEDYTHKSAGANVKVVIFDQK